jgi:aspartate aminotransferase
LRYAQARLCSPAYGQIAAEGALDTPKSYFKMVRDEYIHRRNVMIEEINKIPGVICPMPKGAFYAIAQLPVDDTDKFAQWLLESFSYQGQTVMVAPLAGFYGTKGLGKNQVRIAYVLKEEDLRAAIKCLEEGLKAYPGRTN